MDAWAAPSAGVSLSPSPTIKTFWPAAASDLMRATFSPGITPLR